MDTQQKAPLQQGIELVQKAIEFDNQHRYVEAISFYDQSLLYLTEAIKHETNPGTEATIQAKIKEYQSRSATLKAAVAQTAAPQAPPASSGSLQPSGSGYGRGAVNFPPQMQPGYPMQSPTSLGSNSSMYNNNSLNAMMIMNPNAFNNGGGPYGMGMYNSNNNPNMMMNPNGSYNPPAATPYGPGTYYLGNPSYTSAAISLSTAGPSASMNNGPYMAPSYNNTGMSYNPNMPNVALGPSGTPLPPYAAGNPYAQDFRQPPQSSPYAAQGYGLSLAPAPPPASANTVTARPPAMNDSSVPGGTGKRVVQERSHTSWNPLRPGALHLRAEIPNDIVRLGENVSIHVTVTNPSSQKVDCLRVHLNRSDYRFMVGHTGKIPKERVCEKEYVQGNRFPMREGNYDGGLIFPIPTNIPASTGSFA